MPYPVHYSTAEGSYTMFYLESGEKIMVSQHLKEYEEILEHIAEIFGVETALKVYVNFEDIN